MSGEGKTPLMSPAALGQVSFAITVIVLSLVNAAILPAKGMQVLLPLAITLGGSSQAAAGFMAARQGNTFFASGFIAYGAFWWWFALVNILGQNGVLDIKGAESAIGATLILFGVFTVFLTIASIKLGVGAVIVFVTLSLTFILFGMGYITGNPTWTHLSGWSGLISGTISLLAAAVVIINDTFGRKVIPVG